MQGVTHINPVQMVLIDCEYIAERKYIASDSTLCTAPVQHLRVELVTVDSVAAGVFHAFLVGVDVEKA